MFLATRADNRKHPRVPVNLPATYRSRKLTTDAYVANLSQSGAFIASTSTDVVGTEAELLVMLPGGDQFRLPAKVIWIHRRGPLRGMGINFIRLSREQRLALANFLIAHFYSING